MTADIAAFVLAQLDAEVETARAAALDTVHFGGGSWTAEHYKRQDPQATLDRVDALRAIVAMHRPVERDLAGVDVCSTCADFDTDDEGEFAGRDEDWPCPTLRALAYAYRRQPGWESRWVPEGVEVTA